MNYSPAHVDAADLLTKYADALRVGPKERARFAAVPDLSREARDRLRQLATLIDTTVVPDLVHESEVEMDCANYPEAFRLDRAAAEAMMDADHARDLVGRR